MKKQIHILEGLIILVIIFIFSLLAIKFIYNIRHEKMDTTYMWDISFANLVVTDGSKDAYIKLDDNSVLLDVVLEQEQEFYEFTIDVINNGSLDAKLTDIDINVLNDKDILKYVVSYVDGKAISEDDVLKSYEKIPIKVRIDYPLQKSKIYEKLELKLSLNINYEAIY